MNSFFEKYNVPGPRYTSYPTVPYWETTPTPKQWLETLEQSLREAEAARIGASVYVHIPFCESLCTYCGCNTRITRNHGVSAPYTQILIREWTLLNEHLGRSSNHPLEIGELHLGGGTPTFYSPDELRALLDPLLALTRVQDGAEFSVEADPRVTTTEHLRTLREFGFKRLSLGIQDFDPIVQETVHRVQSEEQVARLVDAARALGYTSINYDLIYGLPFQTPASIQLTLEAVMRTRPDRIAFYSYAHVPWIKPSQRRFTEADLPAGPLKRQLYELGRTLLESAGYREIGMDHFALVSDSLWKSSERGTLHRNFMGYTAQHVSPQIGLGVSAISDSWGAFIQNEKLLETYQARVLAGELPFFRGHLLTEEDRVLRRHVLNLMTRFHTDWNPRELYTEFLETVPDKLSEFERDGLVSLTGRKLSVTDEGRPFLRNICMAFDARLARKAPETRLFSQTV